MYLELSGLFPLYLLIHFSKILQSGLVEWWPNFSKRTDFGRISEKVHPTKPNMRGQTQVIFILLGSGLLIAFVSLVGELNEMIFKSLITLCRFWILTIRNGKNQLGLKEKFWFSRKTRTLVCQILVIPECTQ